MSSPALSRGNGVGLPTTRQNALVLLVMTNAHGRALHPITELHPALGRMVSLPTMWNILSRLLSAGMLRVVGTNDRSAGYALKSEGVPRVFREIESERTRVLRAHETNLMQDAKKLGLELPFRVVYQPPPDRAPDGHSGDNNGTGKEQP